MKRKGISLIVLVITILVLSILATTAIININNTNIIKEASSATFEYAVSSIKEKVEYIKLEKAAGNVTINFEGIVPESVANEIQVDEFGNIQYVGNIEGNHVDIAKKHNLVIMGKEGKDALSKLNNLMNLAIAYNNSGLVIDASEIAMQYIRKDRYNGTSWNVFAGRVDSSFTEYVQSNGLENLRVEELLDPITFNKIDYEHEIASLNAYVYGQPNITDAYACWAGDLCTLLKEVYQYSLTGTYTSEQLKSYAKTLIASPTNSSTFGISDMLADIDATNIYSSFQNTNNLYEELYNYYYGSNRTSCKNRYKVFKANIEKLLDDPYVNREQYTGDNGIYVVAQAVLGGGRGNDAILKNLYAMNIVGYDDYRKISATLKNTVAKAFAEYIEENI